MGPVPPSHHPAIAKTRNRKIRAREAPTPHDATIAEPPVQSRSATLKSMGVSRVKNEHSQTNAIRVWHASTNRLQRIPTRASVDGLPLVRAPRPVSESVCAEQAVVVAPPPIHEFPIAPPPVVDDEMHQEDVLPNLSTAQEANDLPEEAQTKELRPKMADIEQVRFSRKPSRFSRTPR